MRLGTFSKGLIRQGTLQAFWPQAEIVYAPGPAEAEALDVVVGWGRKPSGRQAEHFARAHRRPLWLLEDGFWRSVGLPQTGEGPRTLVRDTRGIYYDASGESDLTRALAEAELDRPEARRWASQAVELIRAEGLFKFNPPKTLGGEPGGEAPVLVVGQVAGDLSLRYGQVGRTTLATLVEAALEENPGAQVWVRHHPLAKRADELPAALAGHPRVSRAPDWGQAALLRAATRVYVQTSQMGLDALLMGREVVCFGQPFYAGWGLTSDRAGTAAGRGRRRSLEELMVAIGDHYLCYLPEHQGGHEHPLLQMLRELVRDRRCAEQEAGRQFCLGFSRWKRPALHGFLAGDPRRVVFCRTLAQARSRGLGTTAGDRLLVWGVPTEAVADEAQKARVPLVRVEDGFLRSVGLGAALSAPWSWVFDGQGIYYDPRTVSTLEEMLQNRQFGPEELARAAALRQRLVALGLSKYNADRAGLALPPVATGRRIFVPGQVEDDASVRLGASLTIEQMLRRVRQENPDAFVVYKPHPDVTAGLRRGYVPVPGDGLVDHCASGVALAEIFAQVDEVHTLTSLAGFEGLLHGLAVTVYGAPFYAGWGLTRDRADHPALARRTRRIELPHLVAATLLAYPRYYDWTQRRPANAEAVAERLGRDRDRPAPLSAPGRLWSLWCRLTGGQKRSGGR